MTMYLLHNGPASYFN